MLSFLVLAGCNACQPDQPAASPATIWQQLVTAHCAQPDVEGPMFIAKQLDAGAPTWLNCMSLGGSVDSCHAPCSPEAGR